MEKIKTITVDGITYSVETDISGKADKINGELPESQLPSGFLFPKLVKSNSHMLTLSNILYEGFIPSDFTLAQGYDSTGAGGSQGSFVIYYVPRDYTRDDNNLTIDIIVNDESNPGSPLPEPQGALQSFNSTHTFIVGYKLDTEGNQADLYVYKDGNIHEISSSQWNSFEGLIRIYTTYRGDWYIINNVNTDEN